MNRKEFVEMYPSINTRYGSKNWMVITSLGKEGKLDLLNFCEGVVKDIDIARSSGLTTTTICSYKACKTTLPFIYEALKEKAARTLAESISSASTKILKDET